ncbi:helix-turn-helix domain-containing protein [Bacteroides hominis]|uniref:helix-turn-helix domain-containing protein n=1 Tax=Bacteroides hominis TaxID=2763023 RepID=UPI003D6AB593
MGEIITKDNERAIRFFGSLKRLSDCIEKLAHHVKPSLDGEHFLTDREVSAKLKVSRRTLQEWRTNGRIAYIALGGKTLYKESDIQAMLEKHHRKAF